MKRRAWMVRVVIACGAGGLLITHHPTKVPSPGPPLSFVGEAACASCHPREAALWRESHHQLAMQPANASTVLGDFADRKDGKLITHTFGVSPLQQYLVAAPGGRLQTLPVAWDSRPRSAGGQRWFPLPSENWNYMCADCHSTNVRKGYDAKTGSYATTFSEMSVSCEACHGPGSRHVSWARSEGVDAGKGLTLALDERKGITWARDASDKPHRSAPRGSDREIEMCARCHSRRGLLHEDSVHGQPLGNDYRVALLDEDLYFADGQMRGEVYEYGSFVQSRMYAEGVTCSDCHNPHRPSLTADDGVCLQCHAPTYATARHHFHPEGSLGSRCVDCHMPPKLYMVVDARRDHSLRVPRPDQSVKLGVPNACNGCHRDRPATWAARIIAKWYGQAPSGHQHFAEALAAGRTGAPGAQKQLAALVADRGQPAIARATALAQMAHRLSPATMESVRIGLADPAAMVRRAAIEALSDTEPHLRAGLVSPLLGDRVRDVRMQAAVVLAGTNFASPELEKATTEYIDAQELLADRPEAHLNLALLYANQHHPERAEAELRRALQLDPAFVPAAVNLADLYRETDRDQAAEPVLSEALHRVPNHPSLLHALGLLRVREKRMAEALDLLESAARGAPENARYAYVHAVALDGQGARREAIAELENVLVRFPNDPETLVALVSFLREAGDLRGALRYGERLEQLEPEDEAVRATVTTLRERLAPILSTRRANGR